MSDKTVEAKDCRNSHSIGSPVAISRTAARYALDALLKAKARGDFTGAPTDTAHNLAVAIGELREAST